MKNFLIFFSIMICISCQHKAKEATTPEKFEKIKWQTGVDGEYPFREKMLPDLLYTDIIRRLKRDSILSLLGEPTRKDTNFLFYRVKQQNFAGMIPLHTKTLVIKFAKDSSVTWIKIHE